MTRFVKVLMSVTSLLALTACGAQDAATSKTVSAPSSAALHNVIRTETTLKQLEVTPINGGISPRILGVNVKGQVLLGSNPCVAKGRKAELVEKQEAGQVQVVAVIEESLKDKPAVCTMDFNPVYVTLTRDVRFDQEQVADVIVKNAEAMGKTLSVGEILGQNALVVSDVVATPINPGINPDFFAYDITVKVVKGANPCLADNTEVELKQMRQGRTIFVQATSQTIDPSRICTQEYRPVYETLKLTVRANRNEIDKVIVKNVDELGHDVNVADLL